MAANLSWPQCVKPSIAGTVLIQVPNLVITVLMDVLAPNGARSSAGTILTTTHVLYEVFVAAGNLKSLLFTRWCHSKWPSSVQYWSKTWQIITRCIKSWDVLHVPNYRYDHVIILMKFSPLAAVKPGISLGLHPANERRRYIVTMSLIGWGIYLDWSMWNLSKGQL